MKIMGAHHDHDRQHFHTMGRAKRETLASPFQTAKEL